VIEFKCRKPQTPASSDTGLTTLKRIELSDEITGPASHALEIQTALEAAGVEFIPADWLYLRIDATYVKVRQNGKVGFTNCVSGLFVP
jgi:hypothetical protein